MCGSHTQPLTVWITTNWKILKEMGVLDHLSHSLLRNLYTGQEATVRIRHGKADWFKIGKGVHQGCILSPCLFSFYAESIIGNARLEKSQAGIKMLREISTPSDMQTEDNPTLSLCLSPHNMLKHAHHQLIIPQITA